MAFVVVMGADERVFPLGRAGLRIGRGPDQDVVLVDPKQSVSRAHAVIRADGGAVTVEDLGSRNGTKVDGAALSPGERRPVTPGAVITVGYHRLRYLTEALPEDAPPVVLSQTEPMRLSDPRAAPTPGATEERLRLLVALARAADAAEDAQAAVGRLLEAVAALLQPERATAARFAPDGDGLREEASFVERGAAPGPFLLSPALVDRARRERVGVSARIPAEVGPRAALCVPLLAGGEAVGLLWADDRGRDAFAPGDLELLGLLGILGGGLLARAVEADGLRRRVLALEDAPRPAQDAATALEHRLTLVAGTRVPVLLTGETGTGKSSCARRIHARSARAKGPFVAVNCAALPETLLEAELFGYARRSGIANADPAGKPGRFALADGGTLFLDEIGDMPLVQQAKLLTALEDKEIFPLGATRPVKVDVAVVAATARDLAAEVAAQRFRADLYYRLARVVVEIPPLRARREEIPALAMALLARLREDIPRDARGFTEDALEALAQAPWPGNIRELENAVAHALLCCGAAPLIRLEHLPAGLAPAPRRLGRGVSYRLVRDSADLTPDERARRDALVAAIEETGSLTRAARQLGMSKQWAVELARRLGIRLRQGEGDGEG